LLQYEHEKTLFLFILGSLITGCVGKKEPLYNCYELIWLGNTASNWVPQPELKLLVKDKNRDEAKQAVAQYIKRMCNLSRSSLCKDITDNSYVDFWRDPEGIEPDTGHNLTSYFCIPVELDTKKLVHGLAYRESSAYKYVDANIETYGGAKELFPFDNK
jgi:hypothetical protein